MKTILYTLLFSLFFSTTYSQESKKEDIYIYVRNSDFRPSFLAYKAVFSIKSKDKRFQHDNYYFRIGYHDLDYQTLYSLGTSINIDSINVMKPHEYFKDVSNCELHNELSLLKNIRIITDIPEHKLKQEKDQSKKHIMFYASYAGTLKNWTYMNMFGKNFIDN